MSQPRTREDFIEAARYVPKNRHAVVMGVGYLLFFGGTFALIHGLTVSADSFHIGWRIAAPVMVAGGVVMAISTALLQRGFRKAVREAGFSPDQISEIEAEAARRNAEEEFEPVRQDRPGTE